MREDGGVKKQRRRHPHKVLDAASVKSARAPAGRSRRVADGGGLYLLIAANGSKSWVLRTVVRGRRCDIGLGGLSVVSLKQARDDAQRLSSIARSGGDPFADRRRQRRPIPTFAEAAIEVHAAHAEGFKNAKHRKQWLASLRPAFAAFGAKRVDAVTSADVIGLLQPRWLTRPETSRRVLQRLRAIFDWCRAQGHVEGDNPTGGVTKALPKQRGIAAHHPALPYDKVADSVVALRASDAGEPVKLAFEFMLLTATRTSETVNATWDEVDLEGKTWTIPPTRMKAGIEHRVPLSDRCIEILRRAKGISNGGPYVFPGRTPKRALSNMVFLMVLRRMKRDDITAHGFRSTFRGWAAELTSFSREICEAALAHRLKDKTEAAYNRSDLFERRRELMDEWATYATTPKSRGDVGEP